MNEPDERGFVRWTRHLVFAVMLVSIPFVEWMMIGNLREALRSKGWPTTSGKITKSEVTWDLYQAKPRYSPDLSYDYQVGEKTFSGTAVRVGKLTTKSEHDAEEIVRQFPVGKDVPVFYDPANPSSSCFITGTDWPHYVAVVAPVFFWLVCIAYFYGLWKDRKGVVAEAPEGLEFV